MNVGVIGSGKMGTGLGRLWAKHGHYLMFSYSRRPEKLENLVLEIGSHARSGTPRDAVRFADVLLFAVPWEEVKDSDIALRLMNPVGATELVKSADVLARSFVGTFAGAHR